ncbi:hypothetical protein IscW_ISCW016517 [Ixodes scapularis]|uniref:Uncharacterized protein n=1 Tax=Ixodes scapularis TaxID=6945 RepID=B7P6D7_IXOSC|nr:hypothetical protein IscW_ISCW016517 [Ixodes scapularis]|eukprot:XP_002408532.1 hypothetical protein IscW_ISCW016517 [Ixodes scapularis]
MLVPVYPVPSATPSRQRPTQGGSPEHRQPPDDDGEPADDLVPLRPCREFCHRVEEQCPYFHPTTREQYAGEPVFICIGEWALDLSALRRPMRHIHITYSSGVSSEVETLPPSHPRFAPISVA